jgi:hypothetical protein
MGDIIDPSNNLPDPVALSTSAASEYNEACLACHATSHLHTTLNELEDINTESKEDIPVDILLDNMSAVDMSVRFKDTEHSRHILHISHYVRSCSGLILGWEIQRG